VLASGGRMEAKGSSNLGAATGAEQERPAKAPAQKHRRWWRRRQRVGMALGPGPAERQAEAARQLAPGEAEAGFEVCYVPTGTGFFGCSKTSSVRGSGAASREFPEDGSKNERVRRDCQA